MSTSNTIQCQHTGQMDTLMLLNSRATSAASTAGHIRLYNELIAECQNSCGDRSPYRDAEALPEPVYCSGRYGLPEMLAEMLEPLDEIGNWLAELAAATGRRLRRRRSETADTEAGTRHP